MHIAPGTILSSSPLMDDPNFMGASVLITEYNEEGATAFVFNKRFERRLNELVEFSSGPAFPLYAGGPVDKEHLFFVHHRNDLIPGGELVSDNVYFGGDFTQAIAHINSHTLTEKDIKIFIGYCGWDKGELEAEIGEGSWLITDELLDLVFED